MGWGFKGMGWASKGDALGVGEEGADWARVRRDGTEARAPPHHAPPHTTRTPTPSVPPTPRDRQVLLD